MKLKVCGLMVDANIADIVALKPDYVGFNFYRPSKRFVGENFVMPDIPGTIKKVGVFVNDTMKFVLDNQKKHKLDYVQLHGDESPEYCKDLVMRNVRLIKAFGVDEHFDFYILRKYRRFCDYFLFDYKSSAYGGSGKQFDWSLLNNPELDFPFFLSGGIGPDSLNEITSLKNKPYGLDVNSKFESSPGVKDVELVRNFIKAINEFRV